MGQACTPEKPCELDLMCCRDRDFEDYDYEGPYMASRAVIEGKRSRRHQIGVQDVWKAFENSLAWQADMSSDAWASLVARHPEIPKDWDLTVLPEKSEALPGLPFGAMYFLRVLLGNEWHGRSTLSSFSSAEWSLESAPKLVISGSRFLLSLWPMMLNGIGQKLLSSLTGHLIGEDREPDIGEDEPVSEREDFEQFLLAGTVCQQTLVEPLELRVRWMDSGILQSINLPFVGMDTLTERMKSWKRCQVGQMHYCCPMQDGPALGPISGRKVKALAQVV